MCAKLTEVGTTWGEVVAYGDEMRVGLHGQTRRCWGVRGVKVVNRLQISYTWQYLVVFVEIHSGRIWWTWVEQMDEGHLLGVMRAVGTQTPITTVVWDGAPSHRGARMRGVATAKQVRLVTLPPYSPELNPAERVFEVLRGVIEGTVYPNLAAKVAAVTAHLTQWEAHPEQVRRLVGWRSITTNLDGLPDDPFYDLLHVANAI